MHPTQDFISNLRQKHLNAGFHGKLWNLLNVYACKKSNILNVYACQKLNIESSVILYVEHSPLQENQFTIIHTVEVYFLGMVTQNGTKHAIDNSYLSMSFFSVL